MNKDLIQRFLKQQTSAEESEKVIKWFSNPKNEDEVSAIFKFDWENTEGSKANGKFDQTALFDLIKSRISDEKIIPIERNQRKPGIQAYIMKIAAIITLALGMSYLVFQLAPREEKITAQANIIDKVTSRGQRSTILLSDGSKVILNADSKISYNENFQEKLREVILEGEAFFDVAKDPDRPFKVRTSNSVTTALGTSFNISAYSNDNSSKISLATGKVEVIKTSRANGKLEGIFLEPGEEALVNVDQSAIVKQPFNSKKVLSWKSGILYFDNTGLRETFNTLERWYNVNFEIHTNRDINNLKGTGEFENEKLSNVLSVLGHSMGFKYELKGKNVIIDFINP